MIPVSLEIREARKDDARALSDLFIAFIGRESDIDKMQEKIEIISGLPNYHVVVACKDEHVIGTAMGIVCMDIVGNCNPYMLVENVVVSPIHQGKGIGKMLMKVLENNAAASNCNYIILASSDGREDAHRFYESIGYQGVKRGFIKRMKNQI
ncbi:GNAT family N-acetyltransferase [Paenibacillus mendelii]|uniref:GNAT family N-acetyltransferase n=1 Tax=Paenibacillus mendelii TaxID=206163 RepID=A0ABV6JEL4_9BACL|nr:GNAT family N-acetyltransferase [Paenibacillus mendelii]MCQ6557233.1 GNAT family N-acetyltransferase [Paenibacillus mendelii]